MIYGIIIILKYISDISKVIILEGLKTINVLSIYQDYSTTIHNGIPRIDLQFEIIKMIKSLLQRILLVIEKISHGCGWGGEKVAEGMEALHMH